MHLGVHRAWQEAVVDEEILLHRQPRIAAQVLEGRRDESPLSRQSRFLVDQR
jgi:hypothetical protein